MKKIYYFSGLMVIMFAAAAIFSYHFFIPQVQESITYFPIDPRVNFTSASTSLSPTDKNTIAWKITSTLDRQAYLRQDAGFLFSNGKLIEKLGDWKQNTSVLTQEKQINITKSEYLQAITFHHAELHKKGNEIFSAQTLSDDTLYTVIQSPTAIQAFHTPETTEQRHWKQTLDEQTERTLRYSWNKGIRHFSIHLEKYRAFPLNEFDAQAKNGLPGFSMNETARVIGQLWEGLYKGYFLGIKKQDGTVVDPLGSTIPLILLANDRSHLLVLTETADGEPILLRQMTQAAD